MQRFCEFSLVSFLGASALTLTLLIALSTNLRAQSGELPNLAPEGWVRDTRFNALKMDQYKTKRGNVEVALVAFPPTKQDAMAWTKHFIDTMLTEDRTAGHKIHLMDVNKATAATKAGSKTSKPAMDSAAFFVTVLRPQKRNLLFGVRSIIRPGDPVQVSLRRANGGTSKLERQQIRKLQTDARLPLHQSAAALERQKRLLCPLEKPLC